MLKLRNPIYIGYPAYNKCSNLHGKHKRSEWKLQPKKEELVIVDKEVFLKTQELMDKRKPYENHSGTTTKNTFLLSNLIYCGYCGKKLKAENNRNRPKKVNGKSFETKIYRRYVCEHAKNKHEIHEQRDFGADKHEDIIISLLADVMKKATFFIDEKGIKQEKESCLREIERIKEELSQLYSSYFQLKNENQLERLAKLEKDILEINKNLFNEETSFSALITKENSIELLNIELPNWNSKYYSCSVMEKRQMLGRIIEKVILKKGSFELLTKDYIAHPAIISHKIKEINSSSVVIPKVTGKGSGVQVPHRSSQILTSKRC
ncbi:recombinase zinc beta ribbon domain-containing protein [Neobacillus sp. NPDC058068]|uniref:recombinase zinc beta ribbon domain-containing protein n=1 Tax=Neobacillus sp. NPDC058068 TaxID=3346325 RepID=UPI0036D9AFC5